ncbi:MAG: phosphate acyltransferase PlsX [Deltaproteobacteria bacterium]|jgi:glycerol-3-phosphate acyltransferase PlsX|nr:phosphate acyltransferase PlsX [Deltaproteobacteria bacterium]
MGGDFGPSVTIPGALQAAAACGCKLMLVGRSEDITRELDKHDTSGISLEIIQASEVAEMHEKPSDILRRKKDSSIQVACRLVKDGLADGLVSPGHSGATVACAMFIIGRIPGVERLGLASIMPSEKDPTVLLDVGANVDCRPHHLFQFGLMGSSLAQTVLNRTAPKVGILSIGEEEGKGNSLVKDTYELLKMAKNLNFVGNVEGRDLFTGELDVIVCDGFVGNVALKLAEGLGTSLGHLLKKALFSSLSAKLGALLAKNALRRFAQFADYAEYGGAPLLGLQGVALVCHGKSNAKAIRSAVKMASTYVEKKTNDHLVASIIANEELTLYSKATK